MIKVKVEENNNYISKVTIKGHANYDELGKDIVCAAVSSIVITTVNAIEKLDKTFINHNLSKDILTINIVKNSDVVSCLINNMIDLLKELESYYPKNIKIL